MSYMPSQHADVMVVLEGLSIVMQLMHGAFGQ